MKLGKYKLVRRLAQGGMGEVWEGALEGSKGFARRVAIKRMTGLEDVPGWENMFLDEARIASALHHANIVPVLDYGVEDGKPYQVLELIDGLDSWKMAQMAAEKRIALPYEVALHLCTEVAHALHYAHNARGEDGRRLKIVHRDVTPDNVLVSWEGDVKLSDFGIAKARDKSHKTQVGVRVGKPSYMAPEQATGGDVDERTDVFMLGCVLQALLTGRSPLAGDNRMAELLTGTELPVDPRLPDDIKAIIARAVKRSKAERFDDAQQMADALGTAMTSRLKKDARSVTREFLQQLRPPVKTTAALDKLLVPENDETAQMEKAMFAAPDVTERRPGPPDGVGRRSRAPLLAGIGLLAVAGAGGTVWFMQQQQAVVPPPLVVVDDRAKPEAVVPPPKAEPERVPPPVEPAPADAVPVVTVRPKKTEEPKPKAKAKTEVAAAQKPEGKGVLLIGGAGAARAEIKVDGKSLGFAPKRLELQAGAHQVELVSASGAKIGAKKIELTERNTEADPYKWIVE